MKKSIKYRNCGKMVSSKAKRCRHCSTLLEMPLTGLIITLLFLGLIIAMILVGFLQSG